MTRPPSYPNHVLHPEGIPSLSDVPDELRKRRHVRSADPLALESFDNELPTGTGNVLQDELQRAVQNQLRRLSSISPFHSLSHS